MRFDLKKPCKHCPFRTDDTAIRFQCRERAEEIEESAYRNGFPCHESADLVQTREDEEGFVFGRNTQHCAGATIMYLKDGGDGNVIFENLSDAQQDRIWQTIDIDAPVFSGPDEFLDSYGPAE